MKKLILFCAVFLILPWPALGATQKIYTGVVTQIAGTQLQFSTASGAYYTVQTQNITLMRRYGAPMQVSEIIVGDKIQVTGTVRPDNTIAASLVRNMSLYAHNSTFSGKITALSPLSLNLTINSRTWGTQVIHFNSFTVFKINTVSATVADLAAGMTVTVKGAWERTVKNVAATSIVAIVRLVAINFTGTLVMRGGTALTVIGTNSAIYGLNITSAKLLNKKNQPVTVDQLGMSDVLKVWGKHISGSTEIIVSKIKDTSR